MRLSAYVAQHGISPFTADDFDFVGSKLAVDPGRLILVGGQALEVWGIYFDVLAPTGDRHPLTEDTDWLGNQSDAQWLCALLGPEVDLQLPADTDHTPNTGLALLKRPDGRVLMMDFLRAIVGVSNSDIKRLAVPIEVRGATLHVLHPLLCLQSRMANVHTLENKRKGNGPLQARWAVGIVAAYLERLALQAEPHEKRQIIRACHKVAEIAEYQHGRYCYLNFEIDPLQAVTPTVLASVNGAFQDTDWPNTIARIEAKRAKWRRIGR